MTKPRAPTNRSHSPVMLEFIELADQLGYSLHKIALETGLASNALYRWNTGGLPSLANFEAALNVIGYRLAIVPMRSITEGVMRDD